MALSKLAIDYINEQLSSNTDAFENGEAFLNFCRLYPPLPEEWAALLLAFGDMLSERETSPAIHSVG